MAERFKQVMLNFLFKFFREYFNFLEELIRIADPKFNLKIKLNIEEGRSLDDRIAKIDSARENLEDAISAIDELRHQAAANKDELEIALMQLSQMEEQKIAANAELEALEKLAGVDTQAFRRVAGIPTTKDIWRERVLGFGSGIVASIVASLIYAFIISIYKSGS